MNVGDLIYPALVLLYILYRFREAKKREEAQRKRVNTGEAGKQVSSGPQPYSKPGPPPDMYKEVEMKTKPYAQPSRTASSKKEIKKQVPPATPKKEYQK